MDPYSHEFSIQKNALIHLRCGKCNTCGSTSNSDSDAFSKVIMFPIHRMSTIAIEAFQGNKLLIDDENAMVNILKNIRLMKSTLTYLLQEMHNDADKNHNEICDAPFFETNDEAEEDCDDLCSMFYKNSYEQKDNEEDDNKEQLIAEISKGLVGGIAIMSMIAKDAFKTRKLILAEDKDALAEMLEMVQMVKLLST